MSFEAAKQSVSPTIRITAWTLVLLVVIVIVSCLVSKIEIIARGQGKIAPAGRVHLVQAQQSGKVTDILVKDGDSVSAGQILVRLDKSDTQSQVDLLSSEIEKQNLEQTLSTLVLTALAKTDPADFSFLADAENSVSNDKSSQDLVVSTLNSIRDEIIQIDAEIQKMDTSTETQKAKISANEQELDLVQKRYSSALGLRKSGTISQFDLQDREGNLKKIQGDLDVATREATEIISSKNVLQKQRAKNISNYKATYEARLSAAKVALLGLVGQLKLQQIRLKNTELLAPVAGRIENLSITTIGGYVDAGARLLSVVPTDDKIEIEAFFENRDIGFMHDDQLAYIKLDAFPAERFGFVKGTVKTVGADARDLKSDGNWVYAVRISLDRDHMISEGKTLKFSPGMTPTIDVVTGERRLASYFFEPIVKAIQDSFGER